ncbi:OmpP1/FadL family transporter [Parapedobacter deserti]|uniref:OmpP1/FadL family transporter n=1 Tax=Parapedobacter deserti TaxID=1912957 RepID=A0ABV7JGC4_9SPHI
MNMYIKRIALSSLLLGFFCLTVQAQYLQDVLRFSQPEQGATARFKGLGNAQNALGGDLSSISGNPAGLGFFGQSDISISFDYANDLNRANYFGTNSRYNVDKLGFNQIGAVFHMPARRARGTNLTSGWLNFNIGIAYNKTNNFNSTVGFTGVNFENSIADFMAYEAYDESNAYGNFGWDAGMVDQRATNNGYDYVPMTMLDNVQTLTNRETGFQSETNVSFGANYANRFYIGGSVGFTRVNHDVNYLFLEDGFMQDYGYIHSMNPGSRFVDPNNDDYEAYNPLLGSEYEFDNEYWSTTTGNGFKAKLGVIFRPVDYLQIGVSATTPTWYRLTNDYEDYFGITNYLTDGSVEDFPSEGEPSYYDYNLRTPYRINGGIAGIFGQGLISADIEYVDYASMQFSSVNSTTDNFMNTDIRNAYTSAVNVRVGGEYLIAPSFLLRAGFGHNGSPYSDVDLTTQTVSGGLGYRLDNVYIDLAYQNFTQKYGWQTYLLDDAAGDYSPVADITNSRNSLFLTVGFKF